MKNLIRNTLALAAVAIATQATAQVTFYEREGFQGDSFTTRRQIVDFSRFGFNDSASSAVVAGETWEVCEDARFGGRCAVLRPGQYPNLRAMGLNNRISSVHAAAREPVPVAAPASVPSSVVFYERESFGGRSFSTQNDISDLGPSGFNDRVSAVEVIGGPWEVCQGGAFVGPCAVLRPGQYPTLKAIGFDNRISSVRALRENGPIPGAAKVVFYESENFTGRSFTTQGEVADFTRVGFNGRASSVDVVGGWFEACQGEGFNGPCVFLRPGRYPSLAQMGLNNRISSVRPAVGDPRAAGNPSAGAPTGAVYDARRRGNEQLFEANVTAVRAVVGTPEQRCWVDRDQVPVEPSRTNIPAGIIGAVIGGILGHQVGDGRGRDLATIGGAVAGGAIGATVGRGDGRPAQTQDVKRCESVPSQARVDLWDVTYTFRGQDYRVQMTSAPGATILVNRDGEPRV